MRIGMTGQTVWNFKMSAAFMAVGTLGDGISSPWWMLGMAISTGNFIFMFATVLVNLCRLILVTFLTVYTHQSIT
jgi:hypothetical protein